MMIHKQMSFEEFSSLAQHAKRIVVYSEMMADRLTPIGVVEQLQEEMVHGTLLESGSHTENDRYSYIAFGLRAQLSAYGRQITQQIENNIDHFEEDPFVVLRQLLTELDYAHPKNVSLNLQAAVGFVTYDAVRLREDIPDRHPREFDAPDFLFNFYHTTLIFDHAQQTLLVTKIVDVDQDIARAYADTSHYLQALMRKITQSPTHSLGSAALKPITQEPQVDISDDDFMQLILQAKQHIGMGDAFQIVLSRCFKQPYTATPLNIYRALRKVSPAPYMFYFPMNNGVVVGASPEKMISVRQGQVEINPIAGTRARHRVEDEEKNARELLEDEKERAEHMMLVDLARNDLGSVCVPGSVQVKSLLNVQHFSHVSHMTSVITGQLQADKDALDALQASFPAGTVSGAPKIRAMEIIDTLERSKRSLYGGALCRLDAHGNLDSCLAIRLAVLRDGLATVRTGAGIVADSNPESEAAETRHKARGLLVAIALAEEELTC